MLPVLACSATKLDFRKPGVSELKMRKSPAMMLPGGRSKSDCMGFTQHGGYHEIESGPRSLGFRCCESALPMHVCSHTAAVPILSAQNLSKAFGSNPVLDGASV